MKDGFVKVCAVTPNISVGDVEANVSSIINLMQETAAKDVSIAAFPMLCVTGATCGDLFLQDQLLSSAYDALVTLKGASGGLETLFFIGLPLRVDDCIYNVAAVLYQGSVLAIIPQSEFLRREPLELDRYFSGFESNPGRIEIDGEEILLGADVLLRIPAVDSLTVGVVLGSEGYDPLGPVSTRAKNGATLLVHMDANPELVASKEYRVQRIKSNTHLSLSNLIYVNAGRGESSTDFVFSGQNIIAECGEVIAMSKCFAYDNESIEENEAECGIAYCNEYGTKLITDCDLGRAAHERKTKGFTTHHFTDGINILGVDIPRKPFLLDRKFAKSPFVSEDVNKRDRDCDMILKMQAEGLRRRMEHINATNAVIGISGGLDSTLALLVTYRAYRIGNLDPKNIIAVTMPGFGTTARTKSNAVRLAETLGCTVREISIDKSVITHFENIGHDINDTNVTYENAQARERTQILMDIANDCNGIVIGTGDLSEMALGWCTYNGDHMSMYGVNSGIPKTMLRSLVGYYAEQCCKGMEDAAIVLRDVLDTPVSPELLPPKDGKISQCTEELVGPYELHDFFLYYVLRWGYWPKKIFRMAKSAFEGVYSEEEILKWEKKFYWRFISQQFKRSCMPDGPKIGSVGLSPRGDLRMPSDATAKIWAKELDEM